MARGEQFHAVDAEVGEDLRADAIGAQIHALAWRGSRCRERTGKRGHQEDDEARAGRADRLHRALQPALARAGRAEEVVKDRERVHTHQRRAVGIDRALLQDEVDRSVHLVAIAFHPPVAAVIAREGFVGDAFDEAVVAVAIGDQVGDGADLQAVAAGEGNEIVEPGHRPVLVHDLTDDARGVQSGEAADVHRRLGMAGADEDAAVAGDERKDVAGGNDILAPAARIDGDRDGARAVGGGDSGGDALARLDRGGKGGFVPGAVGAAHQL